MQPRAVAAIALAILKTEHIVMHHPLTVLTEHGISAYMQSKAFTLSHLRRSRLERILHRPNVTFQAPAVKQTSNNLLNDFLNEILKKYLLTKLKRPLLKQI